MKELNNRLYVDQICAFSNVALNARITYNVQPPTVRIATKICRDAMYRFPFKT